MFMVVIMVIKIVVLHAEDGKSCDDNSGGYDSVT